MDGAPVGASPNAETEDLSPEAPSAAAKGEETSTVVSTASKQDASAGGPAVAAVTTADGGVGDTFTTSSFGEMGEAAAKGAPPSGGGSESANSADGASPPAAADTAASASTATAPLPGEASAAPAPEEESRPESTGSFSFSSFTKGLGAAAKASATTSKTTTSVVGTSKTVTVTGEVDYKAMARKAEAELKELAKEEAARAAQSFEQSVAKSHETERINLMNMMNIAFKVLIESSLGYASVSEDHGPLRECCVLLERVFKHGFNTAGKSMSTKFAARKGPWSVIEAFEKTNGTAAEIVKEVKAIGAIKTNTGRLRAWIRLAFQNKSLPDLMMQLVSQDALINTFYEPYALLATDDAMQFAGLLVSTNTIDCEFKFHPQKLDHLPDVLDLSMYLRDGNYLKSSTSDEGAAESGDGRYNEANFIALQDQKSSLEESNRVLNSKLNTVTLAQERATAEIGPLKEELAALQTTKERNSDEIGTLKKEIEQLKAEMARKLEAQGSDILTERETYEQSRKGMDEMLTITNKQMEREKQLREEVEKELLDMKNTKKTLETELASEKRENSRKTEIIEGLRDQLKEVKALNVTMLDNLQDAQLKVKDTEDALKTSEKFAQSLQGEQQVLGDKLRTGASKRQELESTLIELSSTLQDVDAQRTGLETNIAIEREYRKNVQADLEAEKAKTAKMDELQERFKRLNEKHLHLQASHQDLREQFEQQEATLVEMGSAHAMEKLEMSEMKARERRRRQMAAQLEQQGGKPTKGVKKVVPSRKGDKREFANAGINLGALTGDQ